MSITHINICSFIFVMLVLSYLRIYKMRDFHQLSIWQQSHQLALKVYKELKKFPKDEIFGLTAQMRKSSSSIPTNIAEGCGRMSDVELKRFLVYSSGSCSELEYQTLLSKDLGYLSEEISAEIINDIVQIRKMIYAFINKLPA